MKKILTLLFLLTVSLSSISQNLSNDVLNLERRHGNLRYSKTNEKIDMTSAEQIFNEEQFAVYEKAMRQHKVSIPLWCVTGTTAEVSTFLLYEGIRGHIYYNNHPEEFGGQGRPGGTPMYGVFYMFSAIGYGVSLLPAIPAAVLTIRSHKNLDNLVENYNGKSIDLTLSFGTTNNGVGLVLKF